jgi:hypothetical protein
MNLIEAVRSGKPFKRKIWNNPSFYPSFELAVNELSSSDILADDWEIQEEKIEITRKQLRLAYNKVFSSVSGIETVCFKQLARELGFKND